MPRMDARDTRKWDTVVELSDVTKRFRRLKRGGLFRREYEDIYALSHVNLQVRRGEFLAYAGPNGAGKSTTFKLLCGMLAPNEGTSRLFGMDPIRDRIAVMRRTGVLFGNRSELWWDHPVRASFEWKRDVWAIPREDYEARLEQLVSEMRLGGFMDAFARELSLGQRMRANLALTLLHAPELVLLDEPTLGLDVLAKRDLIQTLKRVNREMGVTLVVTSHDMDDLRDMASRLVLIHRGEIRYDGAFDDLLSSADKTDFEAIIAEMYREWQPEEA
ncbi:MAG: ATP-binding cassette domain-containing protein [Candidatus Faecivicinus sp.]